MIAVWLPVLGADNREAAEANFSILDEPRVRQFYDPGSKVGRWFHSHVIAKDPRLASKKVFSYGIAWDAFFLYARDAGWQDEPGPTLAGDGPILRESASLAAAVERLPR